MWHTTITIETGPKNKTQHTATAHRVGVYKGLDKTFKILCLPPTKKLLWKLFPSLCLKKNKPPLPPKTPNQDQNEAQLFFK